MWEREKIEMERPPNYLNLRDDVQRLPLICNNQSQNRTRLTNKSFEFQIKLGFQGTD